MRLKISPLIHRHGGPRARSRGVPHITSYILLAAATPIVIDSNRKETMKTYNRGSIFVCLFALFLSLGMQNYPHSSPSPSFLVHASASGDNGNFVAEYQANQGGKSALGRALDWGIAKIERITDRVAVSDLINEFVARAEGMLAIMMHSLRELTMSYAELRDSEVRRLGEFDAEFVEVAKLRGRIDRRCLHARSVEETSLCVDRGIEINDRIRKLKSQRGKSARSLERYEGMIAWCASYNNWFC